MYGQQPPRAGSFRRVPVNEMNGMVPVGASPTPSRQPLLAPNGSAAVPPRSPQLSVGVRPPAPVSNVPDIIQWAAPVYYLDEEKGSIMLDIMRLGNFNGPCSVDWHTEDASAIAGLKYYSAEGTAHFEDGEYLQSIEVFMIPDDYWAPTLEFKCVLTDADGCQISEYLGLCRIKICDDDPFPSSYYKEDLLDGKEGLKRIFGPGLFWEYCKLNLTAVGTTKRTLIVMLFDQMPNAYLAFTIYVGMYLVDDLFQTRCSATVHLHCKAEQLLLLGYPMNSRRWAAMLIGLLWFSPQFILHAWAIVRVYIDLDGRARSFLQESLFRKYLNYNEESRNEVKESDMLVSVTEDCAEVADSFLGALNMIALFGKLSVLTYFIYGENPGAIWACFVMPALMLLFACTRFKVLIATSAAEGDCQVDMIALADETCDKYRLIADYGQKPEMSDMFQERVRTLQAAKVVSNRVDENNNQVPMWVGSLFVGGYIATNAASVLSDNTSLGIFLATVAILDQIASDFSEFYTLTMQLAKSLEPLKGLTYFFNLKMDLEVLKESCEQNREKTKSKLAEVLEDMRTGRQGGAQGAREAQLTIAADKLDIELVNVSFGYVPAGHPESSLCIVDSVNLSVSQASVVSIVGQHGAGRSTLLALMSREKHPTKGFLFLPQHLRVLHVAQEPVLLSLSLLDNLTFGATPSKVPGRIVQILKGLKMPKVVRLLEEYIQTEQNKGKPKKKKTSNDATKGSKVIHAAAAKSKGGQGFAAAVKKGEEEEEEEEEEPGSEEEEEEEDETWHDVVTYTDKVKIHLARALICNPEVLVLQRPLYHFNKETGMEILQILKSFVDHRGYCMPGGQEEKDRRPRTVFLVPEDTEQAAASDVIWHLDANNHKITEIPGAKASVCLATDFALLRRP